MTELPTKFKPCGVGDCDNGYILKQSSDGPYVTDCQCRASWRTMFALKSRITSSGVPTSYLTWTPEVDHLDTGDHPALYEMRDLIREAPQSLIYVWTPKEHGAKQITSVAYWLAVEACRANPHLSVRALDITSMINLVFNGGEPLKDLDETDLVVIHGWHDSTALRANGYTADLLAGWITSRRVKSRRGLILSGKLNPGELHLTFPAGSPASLAMQSMMTTQCIYTGQSWGLRASPIISDVVVKTRMKKNSSIFQPTLMSDHRESQNGK